MCLSVALRPLHIFPLQQLSDWSIPGAGGGKGARDGSPGRIPEAMSMCVLARSVAANVPGWYFQPLCPLPPPPRVVVSKGGGGCTPRRHCGSGSFPQLHRVQYLRTMSNLHECAFWRAARAWGLRHVEKGWVRAGGVWGGGGGWSSGVQGLVGECAQCNRCPIAPPHKRPPSTKAGHTKNRAPNTRCTARHPTYFTAPPPRPGGGGPK